MTNNNHNSDKDNHDADDAYRPTIWTITAFIPLSHHDFLSDSDHYYELSLFPALEAKISGVVKGLKLLYRTYKEAGYNVQTLRL
jgi:hypothetical protein